MSSLLIGVCHAAMEKHDVMEMQLLNACLVVNDPISNREDLEANLYQTVAVSFGERDNPGKRKSFVGVVTQVIDFLQTDHAQQLQLGTPVT